LARVKWIKIYDWRNESNTGKLNSMETNVQTEDVVLQKTRELCETIVQQPQFQSIRQQVDSFMADAAHTLMRSWLLQ